MKTKSKKAKTNERIDELVNKAMFAAGGGNAVSITDTAHAIKNDKVFLKLIGLKEPYQILTGAEKRKYPDGFAKIRAVVRQSMERLYGPLVRVR